MLSGAAAILSRIPLDADGTTHIAAPIFHSWGLAHVTLSLPLRSTLVLRRRFDPLESLREVAQHRADALIVVPVMLSRMLELDDDQVAALDVHSLRVIAASGSALPGDLARRVMDRFGDVLYNLYGSTEVAWATVAGPRELREAPGTAGTPPRGTERADSRRAGERATARGPPAASSSATAPSSRATPEEAARRSSAG